MDGEGAVNGKISCNISDELLLESGETLKDLSPELIAKRRQIVNRLQVQLRTEEMKLVLLKKLKQSQVRDLSHPHIPLICLLSIFKYSTRSSSSTIHHDVDVASNTRHVKPYFPFYPFRVVLFFLQPALSVPSCL